MKSLPVCIPKFTTVPSFTHGLAILYGLCPSTADLWVANNCLSARYKSFDESMGFVGYYQILPDFTLQNSSLLSTYTLPHAITDHKSLREIIVDAIDKGCYVSFMIDAFHIQNHSDVYGAAHILHPLLVYGYDDAFVYGADHFLNGTGKYALETIQYTQLSRGFFAANREFYRKNYYPDIHITTLNKFHEQHYSLDTTCVANCIEDYLNSRQICQYPYYTDTISRRSSTFFHGRSALQVCIRQLKDEERHNSEHIRILHEISVHASVLEHAVWTYDIPSLFEDSRQYCQETRKLRNLCVKYMLKNISHNALTESGAFDNLIAIDHSIYTRLFDCIKAKRRAVSSYPFAWR